MGASMALRPDLVSNFVSAKSWWFLKHHSAPMVSCSQSEGKRKQTQASCKMVRMGARNIALAATQP